jgi:hypothetical protein
MWIRVRRGIFTKQYHLDAKKDAKAIKILKEEFLNETS